VIAISPLSIPVQFQTGDLEQPGIYSRRPGKLLERPYFFCEACSSSQFHAVITVMKKRAILMPLVLAAAVLCPPRAVLVPAESEPSAAEEPADENTAPQVKKVVLPKEEKAVGTKAPEEKAAAPKKETPQEKALALRYQRNTEMSKIRRLFLANRTGEMEKAVRAYGAKYPVERDREYYFYLGVALENGGEFRKAVESYRTAIDIAPDYARARNSLGNLYCRLNKYHFALGHFRKALEINPYNPFLQYNLGSLYFETGDLANAASCLEKAIRYKANFGSAYHKLGVLQFKRKQYAAAIEYLSKAMEFKTESHLTHYYIGLSNFNLEKGSLSIASLKRALQMKPDFFEAALELGNVYRSFGEFASALEYYRRAEALNPEYRDLKLCMVECYRELKKHKEGIAVIRQLLEKDPENEQLKKYLKNLQERRLNENLAEPHEYYSY
jgi:tetratricopeptide (TPR) repeat protein